MKSARGIYYDLTESDYVFEININKENIKFYFSSIFLMKKFTNNVEYYIHNENSKLVSYYKIDIDARKLLMISYYKKIEKRGFKVVINNNDIHENDLSLIVR